MTVELAGKSLENSINFTRIGPGTRQIWLFLEEANDEIHMLPPSTGYTSEIPKTLKQFRTRKVLIFIQTSFYRAAKIFFPIDKR